MPGHGSGLETQHCKGGIPTSAPEGLASFLLRLPPILYMQYRIPVSGWSKAPWGLSVLARVTSIFTGISISPGVLTGQASAHIPHLAVSHRPVFLLNSCLGRFSAAALTALLLPKLRSHFAEFLNNTSPAGLRILSSSTCVGLRYGPCPHKTIAAFLDRKGPRLRY